MHIRKEEKRMNAKEKRNSIRENIVYRNARVIVVALLFCMFALMNGQTVFATESSGGNLVPGNSISADKSVKEKSGKIVTENGKKYFEYSDGKKAKSCFLEVKGKNYYFGKKGVMEKGWMKKDGNYYYFDRNTGVQKKNCKVDGIKIKKDGTVKKTSYNKKKIETMIEAKSIMNKIVNVTDTKEQKLKKVFDWVMKHPYNRHRILAQARMKKGWEMTYAKDIYKSGDGCCVSEACAFAFLAHECGYKKVYICDDTEHAWTEINGRVYDTLFAEIKNYDDYYNSTYKKVKLWRENKLKI